jgi:hypothetical protein
MRVGRSSALQPSSNAEKQMIVILMIRTLKKPSSFLRG